jgi:hypothetical protein
MPSTKKIVVALPKNLSPNLEKHKAILQEAVNLEIVRVRKDKPDCSFKRHCDQQARWSFMSPYYRRGPQSGGIYTMCDDHLAKWMKTIAHIVAGDTVDHEKGDVWTSSKAPKAGVVRAIGLEAKTA